MSHRILLVEDDRSIATGLSMNLRHEGFQVTIAGDGATGLKHIVDERPDLVLLDVMLPEMNGFEVLREIRRRGMRTGVIMLTAKGMEEDKVLGLDLGADDYVQKPFGLPELIARVHAVLRRRVEEVPDTVGFGDVVVDRTGRTVQKAGEEVTLTPREFSLLLHLVENEGRALSRESLLDAAWGFDYEGTARTVDNFIAGLRKKFEADPEKPRFFVTVRGVGYRFQR